jgi:tetratricopeptide (TPR) repeat protein
MRIKNFSVMHVLYKDRYIIFIIIFSFFYLFSCTRNSLNKNRYADIKSSLLLKARDHYMEGMFYQLSSNHEKALIEFYQALLYDSTSVTIYNSIAENHMALGRYESASRYLKMSLKFNPNIIITYQLLAECYYKLNKFNYAISYLKKVLKLDPYNEDARALLFSLYQKTENTEELSQQYKEMIDLYGENEYWIDKAAILYMKNGKIDEAISIYNQFLMKDSTNAGMWYSLGRIYELNDQEEDALVAYKKALKYSVKFTEATERIMYIFRKNSEWNAIIEYFEPLQQNYQDILVFRLILAEAYFYIKEYKQSKNLLLPLLKENNVSWQIFQLLGRIEMEEKNYPSAIKYFQKIIDMDNKNRDGWLYLGFVYSDMDSLVQAENNYIKALKYLPDDSYLLSFYAITLNRIGHNEESLIPLEKAIKSDSLNIIALINYGSTLNRLGRHGEAIQPLIKAIVIDSGNINAITTLGLVYDELKMYERLDALYDKALKFYPGNDLIMNNYSYSLSVRGERLNYALQLAKRAIELNPGNGAYLDTIGWIYYKLGEYETALIYIKNSLEVEPENGIVIEHLGDVYWKLGNMNQAKIEWQRAFKFDQENKTLMDKIKQY